MKHFGRLGQALLVAIIAFGTVAFASADRVVASPHAQVTALMREACTGACSESCISSLEHKNEAGTTHGLGQHGCSNTGLTCSYHSCSVSALDPTIDLMRMVANDDLEALSSTLTGQNLVYVAERGVLQVVADCGTVLAQAPISLRRAEAMGLE